jgi:CHAT domain-containing protein/cytochrome c-type biogenesis protein CcmH/NrfG
MRPADSHLTPQEMELLLFGQADPRDSNVGSASAREAQQHLSGCAVCQSVAEKYRKADEMLGALEAGNRRSSGQNRGIPQRTDDCPADEVWLSWAAGLMTDEEAATYVAHAAACSRCASLLREAMEDLAYNPTTEEQQGLAHLPNASPVWQRQMAIKLAAQQRSEVSGDTDQKIVEIPEENPQKEILKKPLAPERKPTIRWWPKLTWATALPAVAIIAVGVGWLVWLKSREPDVNALLAQAYTEQRTIELRISGAEYARIREQRAGPVSNINHSAALYKALSRLAENRRLHDAAWLGAEGRAELLQGDYAASVATLEEAYRLSPQDDDIEIDLASALFQRSAKPGFEEDLPRCVNLLHDVIKRSPQNATAWFNLAIASEKMHLFAEASQAWNEYLKIDPDSRWSQEARGRKEKLEKTIGDYKQRSSRPLDGPDTLANLFHAPSEQRRIIDQRIESYMAFALTGWLPEMAADRRGSGAQSSTKAAAEMIAQLALQDHQDVWFRDLLAEVDGSRAESAGLVALAKSKKFNELGHFQEANTLAKSAARLFAAKNEGAGLLGAKMEEVYSAHLLQQGEICYQGASELLSRLHGKAYAWLEIQTQLEASICANMIGRLREARQGADRALILAETHKYGNLYLRAVTLVSSLEWTSGNFKNAIRFAGDGLDAFWKGSYPPIRGYSLYSVLDSVAEDLQEWFVQVSIGREAVGLIIDSPYHAMLGVECERTGNAAFRSSQMGVAEEYLRKSLNHFALAPEDANTKILRVAADVGMARLDLQQGRFESARQWLEKSLQWAEKTDNRFVQIEFYDTQSEVLQASGLADAAKESSLHAVIIAEKSLRTLAGERERLIWMREYERLYRALMNLELAEDSNEAFFWWEWYRATPLRTLQKEDTALENPQAFKSVSQPGFTVSQHPLADDVVVVSYILLANEAGVWLRHGNDTRYYRLPASTLEIESLVHSLARDCADENSDPGGILILQRRLYDLLVRPFAPQIAGDEKILIEPDGDLDALPFETLVNENGLAIGQKHEISLSPGVAYLASTRPSLQPGSATTALIVENSSSRTPGINELTRFESAADEVESIHRLMPKSRVLRGSEISVAAIMQAARHADIFHFAGHTIPEKDGSGLLLAGVDASGRAEVINATALEKFKIENVKLVVLSACETAGDGSRTLSASGSLARVFLASGVPQVVASRWPVDSRAASLLMESFYRHLLSGSRTVDALRQAQQEMRSQTGYSHPYYWASFSVFGNP